MFFENGPDGRIAQVENLTDLLHRQIHRPQSTDQSGGADLIGVVAPVSRPRIDVCRGQQADLVIVAQRRDRQPRPE